MPNKSISLHQWEMQALLDKRLKQVRRPVRDQPPNTMPNYIPGTVFNADNPFWSSLTLEQVKANCCSEQWHTAKSPYAVGDVLAVKETWRYIEKTAWLERDNDGKRFYQYKIDNCEVDTIGGYESEQTKEFWERGKIETLSPEKWRSPVTMPIWAVRKHLLVTGIRCERVQEMTAQDAVKCGYDINTHTWKVWDKDNPKYLYDSNPWQWVWDINIA
jgi:hypothetical protein